MKKSLVLSLALVLALAVVGVGYAAWTRNLKVKIDVQTGVFKVALLCEPEVADTDGKYYEGIWDKEGELDPDWNSAQGKQYGSATPTGPRGTSKRLDQDVAQTDYELLDRDGDGLYDAMQITVTNAYPDYVSGVTFRINNAGTIPAKFTWRADPDSDRFFTVLNIPNDGFLLGPGESLKTYIGFVVGYDLDFDTVEVGMGKTYTTTIYFDAIQWNLAD